MNVETFKIIKNSPELSVLSDDMVNLINLLSSGKKMIKNNQKVNNKILKNPKMQLLKDKIENKVNLVLNKLSEMNIQSVLCSNLLEHITNREEICQIISSIIPKSGYIFVTVPYKYPYHRDPIDTMFRPDIQELSSLFPDFKIVNGEILAGGYLVQSTTITPVLYTLAMVIRLMLPIYQPLRWFDSLKYALWLFKDISVSCVVLEKVN
jgi:hypothetical protein